VSVKDRWVVPREQVLNVPIECRCNGPGKPNSWSPIGAWLTPLLYWLAQEENWIRTCGSVSRCAVDCVGSPFSREKWDLSKSVSVSRTVAVCGPREVCMVLNHTWTERGKYVTYWSGFPMQGVHRFESP
jgi:hypothetical protein